MKRSAIVAVGCLSVITGCVSQGTYDDLKRKYDTATGKLEVDKSSIAALEESRDEWQAKAATLEEDLKQTREALAKVQAEHAAERTKSEGLDQQLTAKREELAQLLKDKSRLKETTQKLQEALLELARRKVEADLRVAEARSVRARFKPLIDAGTLRVTIDAGRMVLALPSDVLFDTGSARLSKVGRQAVSEVALVLKEDLNDRRFQVEGHTDNVPIHNAQYASNWELAAGRALGVAKLMVEQGMQPQNVSAASHGEHRPAKANDTDAGRAYNRRVEIILVPDLSSLPGFEELKRAVGST
jgi:chemotaxis protein MotB